MFTPFTILITLPVAYLRKEPKKFSMVNKPTVRVYCKSLTKYSLTIRDGKVTLAPTNPSDPHQQWIKEEKFKSITDEKGHSSFALVNKATGQAMKHSIGPTYPVQLIKYDPDKLDKSVLWTRGITRVEGYTSIRSVDNYHLNLDAYDSTKNLERTDISQYGWNGGGNQLWNLASHDCKLIV
uniref:ricin B-like lectin EULS3 n=1 Tax=Erigeron canadensis TaxID=72917 RepID=UPI001CB8E6B5|nr:ricin B-like lectin EULS3 [Erigeron canadensis]